MHKTISMLTKKHRLKEYQVITWDIGIGVISKSNDENRYHLYSDFFYLNCKSYIRLVHTNKLISLDCGIGTQLIKRDSEF